jgi:hypothetical protein
MNQLLNNSPLPDNHIKGLLEWLALAHGRNSAEDAAELFKQLMTLREAAVPPSQRTKFLDLLYNKAEKIIVFELGKLREISLPAPRKIRVRTKSLLAALEVLTQEYFNTLAELFDPNATPATGMPHIPLHRAMETIAWQIRINHLLASPPGLGLWHQLHMALKTARRLGIDSIPNTKNNTSIKSLYTNTLLAAIAQPASFSSAELEFINDYIKTLSISLDFAPTPPLDQSGIFWIDLDKDIPAHALIRRTPAADVDILYFSCDAISKIVNHHHAELEKGTSASALGLPVFANSHAGKGVLFRLSALWGEPSKRKFPRRRQSYRANLCTGLDKLWRLIKSEDGAEECSEWMVTNESPDGYALMHISGRTDDLHVGDIIALQSTETTSENNGHWHICIIRWAISENPEHVELGLELISANATAVEVIPPGKKPLKRVGALMLPQALPIRNSEALVVPSGIFQGNTKQILVMIEKDNFEIRQVSATHMDEQTSKIEIFSVSPDHSSLPQ